MLFLTHLIKISPIPAGGLPVHPTAQCGLTIQEKRYDMGKTNGKRHALWL
jgi:hypothetical protein